MIEIAEELIKSKIRDIPDFPKPGIIFKDITPVIENADAFRKSVDYFENFVKGSQIDYVVGIESRGFIFGAALADRIGAGLVICRKPGKLPSDKLTVSYSLEYGTDHMEIHTDSIEPGKNVVIIDDLLATGGTVSAVIELVKKSSGNIVGVAFLIELEFLKGRQKLPQDLKISSLIKYS